MKFYNNIKDTLIEKGLLTDNHVNLITDKLEEVEDIIKIESENSDDEENEEIEFIRYCFLEFSNLVFQWEKFRDDKKNYMKNVESTLDKSVYGHIETKKQIKRIVGQWINGEIRVKFLD